jgi:hypothetical protein
VLDRELDKSERALEKMVELQKNDRAPDKSDPDPDKAIELPINASELPIKYRKLPIKNNDRAPDEKNDR